VGDFRRKTKMKKTITIWICLIFILLLGNSFAGTWLGTDKMYKVGYGEYGLTTHANYSTTYDNLYDRLWNGGIADSSDNLYVNSGYISGDEDATLYFNATNQHLKYEYLNSQSVSSFDLSERLWINETFTSQTGDFGVDNHGYVLRSGATYNISTWNPDDTQAAMNLLVQTTNNINEADVSEVELSGIGSYVWSLTANSKAGNYAFDGSVVKQSPCVTDNTLISGNFAVLSDRDPTDPMYGSGVRAYNNTQAGYNAVRQHTAFFASGTVGWKYGFYYLDTNGSTVLFSVDQSGNVNAATNVAAYGQLFANFDYVSGDEDAVVNFNSTSETIKWDYGNSRFEISDDLYVEGALKVNTLTGASPAGLKAVYYNTTTKELVYDNT